MRLGWKFFWLLLVGLALVQSVVTLFPSLVGRASVTQPIAFNHQKHAGQLALPCTTCHQSVETQSFAGLPQTEICMTCHAAYVVAGVVWSFGRSVNEL